MGLQCVVQSDILGSVSFSPQNQLHVNRSLLMRKSFLMNPYYQTLLWDSRCFFWDKYRAEMDEHGRKNPGEDNGRSLG